ncbi:hypothetical protein FHW17_004250 [Phyllobacterium sp. P30BS-XVII]|nr:hypothetical protein [Phyllobacterium sp. P30BS-XVII]
MRIQFLGILFAFGCITTPALAATDLTISVPKTIERILSVEAKPGDQARSRSNPYISYRVLENGTIEMTNSQTGVRKFFKPQWPETVNSRGSRW